MNRYLIFAAACAGSLAAHAQYSCATALPITPGTYAVPLVAGDPSGIDCLYNSPGAHGQWYTYTATVDTAVHISSALSQNPALTDTRLHVYTGVCGALACYAADDDSGDSPEYSSVLSFNVEAGTTYYIFWDDYWSPIGFDFEVSLEAPYVPPPPPQHLIPFTTITLPVAGWTMAVVDMNADHLDDLVSVSGSNVNIQRQLSGGGFQAVNIPTSQAVNEPSWSLAAGDLDGNGYNDLLYGGGGGATFMMASDDGTTFEQLSPPNYIFSQRTNMVDINNDGNLDAFVCHDVAANVSFINDGNGNFNFGQGGLGLTCGNYGSVWIDYNNDNHIDCFVAKCGCDPQDLLMRNNGDGTFTNVAPALGLSDSHQSWSSAWGDYDNDGDMDVLIGSSSSSYHKFMRNNGDGTFTNITAGSGIDTFPGQSIEWTTHDFNNDGYLDILGGYGLLVNQGDMTFLQDTLPPGSGPIGDLNNDGFLDVANYGTIYMNQGNDNNWITIATTGTVSNRNGIGARVSVTSAMGTQIRDVKSGDGFAYMSSLNTHFGIGADTEILQVQVRWPSGIVTTVDYPAINGTLEVVEDIASSVGERNTDGVVLFPVPATDRLTVSGTALPNSPVAIMDATGKTVWQGSLIGNTLDVSALGTGVYVLRVGTKGELKRTFTKY